MRSARQFFCNGIMLAAATVGLRAVSVSFNAYITRQLGSEAVGLFTLVMSVYALAVTAAASAVNLASVRLAAEATERLDKAGVSPDAAKRYLHREMLGCVKYSLFFGLVTGAVVLIMSPFIGTVLLGDTRCILSLRLFAVSLPAVSLTSALAGYFTGTGKVYKNALISLLEQATKIVIITLSLIVFAPRGVEYACAAVVGGGAAGEAASLIYTLIFYVTDRVRAKGGGSLPYPGRSALSRAAGIAFPVALGSYVRQGLVCAEHIAIPAGLRRSGAGYTASLASYGVLHGMVFPLIFFPSSVTSAFASLLIPELAASAAAGETEHIRRVAGKVIRTCLIFSICVSVFFLSFSQLFGAAVYDSSEAGRYIAMIAPLIPIMYLDTSVDAVLKGLGQQVYTMKVNILDATLSLLLVLLLIPRFGLHGYIASVYIVETVNCALSLSRLIAVTKLRIRPAWILRPGAAVMLACAGARMLFTLPRFMIVPAPLQLSIAIAFSVLMLFCFGAFSGRDLKYFGKALFPCK